MVLLKILRKIKRKEREMRLLMLYEYVYMLYGVFYRVVEFHPPAAACVTERCERSVGFP
jgi:hypothetical protein